MPEYEEESAESAGTADPTAKFREMQPPPEEVEKIEQERDERLDPENRPPYSEVDNTQRDFDPTIGDFTDGKTVTGELNVPGPGETPAGAESGQQESGQQESGQQESGQQESGQQEPDDSGERSGSTRVTGD